MLDAFIPYFSLDPASREHRVSLAIQEKKCVACGTVSEIRLKEQEPLLIRAIEGMRENEVK